MDMLLSYSSSSSCEGSDVGEQLEEINPATQRRLDDNGPKCKRAKVAKDGCTKLPLPKAIIQLGSQNSQKTCCDELLENENSAKHGGRIRSFKHERGNWATYVYIPVGVSILEEVQELCQQALADVVELQLPTDLHLSLSRTVILQFHLIDSFIKSLEQTFEASAGFSASLCALKIYTNEERTRTFIAFKIDDLYFEKLHKLLTKVDAVMKDYKMPEFYENPSFHVSFLWCLGDQVQLLNGHLDKLMNVVNHLTEQECFSLNIAEINCKTGNKQFTFKLK